MEIWLKSIKTRTINTRCSGRRLYHFGPDNNFTTRIDSQRHLRELMTSVMHQYELVEPPKIDKEKEASEAAPKKGVNLKKEKRHGKIKRF